MLRYPSATPLDPPPDPAACAPEVVVPEAAKPTKAPSKRKKATPKAAETPAEAPEETPADTPTEPEGGDA